MLLDLVQPFLRAEVSLELAEISKQTVSITFGVIVLKRALVWL